MMPNPRLAARYAKSILGLAIEKSQLEEVYKDMVLLQETCKSSRDFVNLLRSPIIKALVRGGQLKIAAAMHDITTGKVTWLS